MLRGTGGSDGGEFAAPASEPPPAEGVAGARAGARDATPSEGGSSGGGGGGVTGRLEPRIPSTVDMANAARYRQASPGVGSNGAPDDRKS